jgi:hypothetical protein
MIGAMSRLKVGIDASPFVAFPGPDTGSFSAHPAQETYTASKNFAVTLRNFSVLTVRMKLVMNDLAFGCINLNPVDTDITAKTASKCQSHIMSFQAADLKDIADLLKRMF